MAMFAASSGFAQIFDPFTLRAEPANLNRNVTETVETGHVIYSLITGDPIPGFEFTFQLLGIGGEGITIECVPDATGAIPSAFQSCGNGGHTHDNPQRPLIFDRAADNSDGRLEYPALKPPSQGESGGAILPTPTDPTTVQIVSKGLTVVPTQGVTWEIPQVAGIYHFTSTVKAKPGGYFYPLEKESTYSGTLNLTVSARGLRQLPEQIGLYVKLRGGPGGPGNDMAHVDEVAFAGNELTLDAIPLIAREFLRLSANPSDPSNQLYVNDISLPKGGIFDWTASPHSGRSDRHWLSDHIEHREGLDVDINKSAPNLCIDDPRLAQAVNMWLEPVSGRPDGLLSSALLCESSGGMHIDITALRPFPTLP